MSPHGITGRPDQSSRYSESIGQTPNTAKFRRDMCYVELMIRDKSRRVVLAQVTAKCGDRRVIKYFST